MAKAKKKIKDKMSEEDDYDCNTFSPYMATPEDSLQKDIEAIKESYNDQETQDWMNASLGKPAFTTTISDGSGIIIVDGYSNTARVQTNGFVQILPEIDPTKLSDILFEELLKFKKSKGYAANSPVDLKEIADNVAKSFIVDLLDK